MTGPPYPKGPGSGAIGSFEIGVSPIGDISQWDPWVTLISQYANSPTIDAMITSYNAAMDQTVNMANFFDMIWNVLTAQGYGLDVWGRIVGVGRVLTLPGDVQFFGFEEAGSSWTGFGQAGFFSGDAGTSNFELSDENFRTLILAKAAGNISDGSIQSTNDILMTLFPNRGPAYVIDNMDMTMVLNFTFPLTVVELAILGQAGVFPIPAGVVVTIAHP